jgi:hypothetical protein
VNVNVHHQHDQTSCGSVSTIISKNRPCRVPRRIGVIPLWVS